MTSGAFTLHAVGARRGEPGFASYLNAYEQELGEPFRQPRYTAATARQFTGTFRNVALDGTVIAGFRTTSPIRTAEVDTLEQDQIRLYVVHRGTLLLDDPIGRGPIRLAAGNYLLGHVDHEYHFDITPPAAALMVLLPGHLLRSLLAGKPRMGSTIPGPVRMLAAHAEMIQQNLPQLGPYGKESAAAALVELTKGVALSGFDDREPSFAPALLTAAHEVAEQFLESPDLSPRLIAEHLHVSVRTLQRCFADVPEPLSAYIRRRRLEEAARMLLGPRPAGVSEAAARWHFADRSHFVKSFKKHYGHTPSEWIRLRRGPHD